MPTRNPSSEDRYSDANTTAAVLVRKATGTKRVRGEDLLSDPKLKKEFREIKKRASKKS